MKKGLFATLLLMVLVAFGADDVLARENVTDWYIKDFQSQIVVNKDSSLDITEKIIADCGNAVGKHGIFRILPETINIAGEKVKNPVQLVSITDFAGNPLEYTESKNGSDDTVTWKIGDPNVTVQGENEYQIHYKVKNTIRFSNPDFDELYWNLSGNFWDLEIDKFHADIIFPQEITKENSKVEYYTGSLGEKRKDLATSKWGAPNVLQFDSTGMLAKRQGITASITFGKNIFIPHKFSFFELYGKYFFLLLPLIIFCICFYLWFKYGKDPRVDKTVIAEYDAPGRLSAIEMGMLMTNGTLKNEFITAEIINLAVRGVLTIKEVDKKILIFSSKDYEFAKTGDSQAEGKLDPVQKIIFEKLFAAGDKIELSSLKDSFYKSVKDIKDKTLGMLEEKKLIVKSALTWSIAFKVVGPALMFLTFVFGSQSFWLGFALFFSGVIILLFGIIMPRRTREGAELNWQVKGFKLFMETVDKDRATFYEKENIFEKFLPYAMMFGITGIWIKRIREIYGEEYFAAHAPIWYAGSAASFDADSFSSTMDSLSSAIAANTSAPSGSGGGGSSGGGGGGGGGGGW